MDETDIFNKWYAKNIKSLKIEREILQAGEFYLIQRAFIAGFFRGRLAGGEHGTSKIQGSE